MGLNHSQDKDLSKNSDCQLSTNVTNSSQEVIDTFRKDVPLLNRSDPTKLKKDLTKNQYEDNKYFNHRSNSFDQLNSNSNSSIVKLSWICQFCQTSNQSDCQLCFNCGSDQINLYIPMNNQYTDQSVQTQSQLVKHPSQNFLNKMSNETDCRRSVLITHKCKSDEDTVLKHYEKLVKRLSISQSKFNDETFPSTLNSIYINGYSLSKTTLDILPDQQNHFLLNHNILWLRPDQINPPSWSHNAQSQWTVFRNPKPNDVLQGALGDCWFITALSVLAEQPEYLMKVLITKEYNPQGIYYVRLCKDGQWTQVLVDDLFPCTSTNNRLAYSQSRRKQLWVPLIEKALAKLNGSYEAIIAGRCCEGLSTVTGAPCETLILGNLNNPNDKNVDLDYLWNKLLNARQQKFLMCAMCSNHSINKQDFLKYGLLNIHAYSLQDIKQSNDGKHKLVKLRNPWGGNIRWNGDWSDDCPLWEKNPELRQQLLKEKLSKRDGVFWMPFQSFVKYFECVDICKIRRDWYELRDSSNFYFENGMMQAYYLTIKNPTQLDLTLYRKISKNLRIQRSEVSLCVAIVNFEQQNNGNYRIYSIPILSQRGQHKFVSTNGYLQPGIYLILPFLFNPLDKHVDNTEFNIAVHSSDAIDLQRVEVPLRIEREFLIKLCLFYGEKIEILNDNKTNLDDGVQIYELKKYWDGLILLVENRNLNKYVHFYFRCTLSQNAFISRKDSRHQLFDVIPPMHRQIIVTIARKNASHSFTIGHDFQYNLSSQPFIKNHQVNKQQHWPLIDQSDLSQDIHLPQPIAHLK